MFKKQKNGLNGYLIVPVTFTAKSLWYEPREITYNIDVITNELRWDFTWDPIFSNYDNIPADNGTGILKIMAGNDNEFNIIPA